MPFATITIIYGFPVKTTTTLLRRFRTWKGAMYGDIKRLGKCKDCHETFWWWDKEPAVHPQTGKLIDFSGTLVCSCGHWREKFNDVKEEWDKIRRFFK